MLKNKILSSVSGQEEKLYVDDVFSTWLRTGTGADVTVTTGIDMAKGYGLWTKGRSGSTDHALYHSARGVTLDLATNTPAAQTTQATGLKSVSATGHTVGSLAKMNTSGATYVDWVFRNADKFYNHAIVTKSAGSNATVSFSNLNTLGMVRVKRTDSTGSWYIWHRSLSAGQLLIGETTAAAATLGHVTVSGTTVTLVNGVIADGTYLVEAFAHDSSADGVIQCGSFTTDGSGNATVNLGWEPQYVMWKSASQLDNWHINDQMRGWPVQNPQRELLANSASAESDDAWGVAPTATGLKVTGNYTSSTQIYLAIRRPNKPPTTGTQVYIPSTSSGVIQTNFPVDMHWGATRAGAATNHRFHDRLRGGTKELVSSSTASEATAADLLFDSNVGLRTSFPAGEINHFFRRSPGFMDVVCWTGSSSNPFMPHGLGVFPELVISKNRGINVDWDVQARFSSSSGATGMLLNTTGAATAFTAPSGWSTTVFTAASRTANNTYISYLFSSLQGISKVGNYIGNGSNQVVNCGFSIGARLVLIKRIDSPGDWYLWNSASGIISSNDPHLSLNTTVSEVITDDSIDPAAAGFVVNQNAATNINVNAGNYIFLAIS